MFYGVADAETASHGGHLPIKLLPCDLVVKAQPAELDLHPEQTVEGGEKVLDGWRQEGGKKTKQKIQENESKAASSSGFIVFPVSGASAELHWDLVCMSVCMCRTAVISGGCRLYRQHTVGINLHQV